MNKKIRGKIREMKFIVIEGLDGSGKSTQINLLKNFLEDKDIEYEYLHFPQTECGVYGNMVSRFLRGEFGDVTDVNPYLVSLLYAGDREDAKKIIESWLKNGHMVIVDRYVYSNIAFQCAKFRHVDDKERLEQWLLFLEYEHNNIPKPQLSLYLDMPIEFIRKKLSDPRVGNDRDYLKGQKDIHEGSMELQKNVRKEYLRLTQRYDDIIAINCTNANGRILNSEAINQSIIKTLCTRGIL